MDRNEPESMSEGMQFMYSICGDYRDKTAEALRPAIVRLECGLNALVVEHPELHSAVLRLRSSFESRTVAGIVTLEDVKSIFAKTLRMPDVLSLLANGIRISLPPNADRDFDLFRECDDVFRLAEERYLVADDKEIQAWHAWTDDEKGESDNGLVPAPLSPEQEWELLEPFIETAKKHGLGTSREYLNAVVKDFVNAESTEKKELQKVLEDTLSAAGVTIVERWIDVTNLLSDEDDCTDLWCDEDDCTDQPCAKGD